MAVAEENIIKEQSDENTADVSDMENTENDTGLQEESPKTSKVAAVIKVAAPLLVIFACMALAAMMIRSAISHNSYIDGRFVLSGSNTGSYIDIDSNGEYEIAGVSGTARGEWSLQSGVMKFQSSDGTVSEGEFIDKKYIVIKDKNFLTGEIPDGEFIEAEVVSSDGVSYGFREDGKFYQKEDGRYEEAGSYITDGYFIIITTEEQNTTYIKCRDGITSVFYQAS